MIKITDSSQIIWLTVLFINFIGLACNTAYVLSNGNSFLSEKARRMYQGISVINLLASSIIFVIALQAIDFQPTQKKMYDLGYKAGYKVAMDAKIQHILKELK